jgi:hypothetical protein
LQGLERVLIHQAGNDASTQAKHAIRGPARAFIL